MPGPRNPFPSFLSFFLPISSLFSCPCFRFVHGAMELAGHQGLPSHGAPQPLAPTSPPSRGPITRPAAYEEGGLPLAKPPPELLPAGSAPGRSPKSIPGLARPFPASPWTSSSVSSLYATHMDRLDEIMLTLHPAIQLSSILEGQCTLCCAVYILEVIHVLLTFLKL